MLLNFFHTNKKAVHDHCGKKGNAEKHLQYEKKTVIPSSRTKITANIDIGFALFLAQHPYLAYS